jgi:hypothetical protein
MWAAIRMVKGMNEKEPPVIVSRSMSDSQFARLTQSVGVGCFVKYYRDFADFSQLDTSLIRKMREAEGYTYGACQTRVTKAREIIRAGRGRDVLKLAARSPRVSPTTASAARRFLQD